MTGRNLWDVIYTTGSAELMLIHRLHKLWYASEERLVAKHSTTRRYLHKRTIEVR